MAPPQPNAATTSTKNGITSAKNVTTSAKSSTISAKSATTSTKRSYYLRQELRTVKP